MDDINNDEYGYISKRGEKIIETLEQQVTDIGEGLGRLLWDLYYVSRGTRQRKVRGERYGVVNTLGIDAEHATFLLVRSWLDMDFSQEVMAATHNIYDHPED